MHLQGSCAAGCGGLLHATCGCQGMQPADGHGSRPSRRGGQDGSGGGEGRAHLLLPAAGPACAQSAGGSWGLQGRRRPGALGWVPRPPQSPSEQGLSNQACWVCGLLAAGARCPPLPPGCRPVRVADACMSTALASWCWTAAPACRKCECGVFGREWVGGQQQHACADKHGGGQMPPPQTRTHMPAAAPTPAACRPLLNAVAANHSRCCAALGPSSQVKSSRPSAWQQGVPSQGSMSVLFANGGGWGCCAMPRPCSQEARKAEGGAGGGGGPHSPAGA